MAGDSKPGHTFVQMDTRQHVAPGLRPTGPTGNNPARTAGNGRKSGNTGQSIGTGRENRFLGIVAGCSGIVARARNRVSADHQPANPTVQPGNIIIKRDSKIAVLHYIPVRTPCIVHSITHGDTPYYWLRDARTNQHYGGICAELMIAFRKVRSVQTR